MHALMQASTVLNAIWMALVMCSSASASWSVEDVYVLYSWSDGLRIAWSNLKKKKKAIYARKEDGHVSNIFFLFQEIDRNAEELITEEEKERRKAEKRRAKKKVCMRFLLTCCLLYLLYMIRICMYEVL